MVRSAEAEFDQHPSDMVVVSIRGGAVAMNVDSRNTPLVILWLARKRWGTATRISLNNVTAILHIMVVFTMTANPAETALTYTILIVLFLMFDGNRRLLNAFLKHGRH